MNNNEIKFEEQLTNDELNYWSKFLDSIPTPSNNYITSSYNVWTADHPFKELAFSKVLEHINIAAKCNTTEELIESLSNDKDIEHNILKYKKAIKEYCQLFPNIRPVDLMTTIIYLSSIQDINIEIDKNGIKLIGHEDEKSLNITFSPQIAMLADLMNGRIRDLDPSYPGRDIHMYGSVQIGDKSKTDCHHVVISYGKYSNTNNQNKPSVIVEKKINYMTEFSIDFSGENFDNDLILSPLGEKQNKFINILSTFRLDRELNKTKEIKPRYKI